MGIQEVLLIKIITSPHQSSSKLGRIGLSHLMWHLNPTHIEDAGMTQQRPQLRHELTTGFEHLSVDVHVVR
jgi:hypothetical protein